MDTHALIKQQLPIIGRKIVFVFTHKCLTKPELALKWFVINLALIFSAIIGFHPIICMMLLMPALIKFLILYDVPDQSLEPPSPKAKNELYHMVLAIFLLVTWLSSCFGALYFVSIWDTKLTMSPVLVGLVVTGLSAIGMPATLLIMSLTGILKGLFEIIRGIWNQEISLTVVVNWDNRSKTNKSVSNINEYFKTETAKIAIRYACYALPDNHLISISPNKNLTHNVQLTKSEKNLYLTAFIAKDRVDQLLPEILKKLHELEVYQKQFIFGIPVVPGLSYQVSDSKDITGKEGIAVFIPCFKWYDKTTQIITSILSLIDFDATTQKAHVKVFEIHQDEEKN